VENEKYKNAIYQYEVARRDISALTDKISSATGETDQDNGFYTANCRDVREGNDCISRSWERNRKQHYAQFAHDECGVDGLGDVEQLPTVTLCPACIFVQQLVDDRKEAKKRFGIAKRRISQMGRGLINGN